MQYDQNNGQNSQPSEKSWSLDLGSEIKPKHGKNLPQAEFSLNLLSFPLTEAKIGEQLWIVELSEQNNNNPFFNAGLIPNTEIQLISRTSNGSVIVRYQNHYISLGANMANKVIVSNNFAILDPKSSSNSFDLNTSTYLRELPPGTKGRVVGYEKAYQGYSGKLLSMGLTPGTEFTVIRHAPWGDPVEIEVEGCLLQLNIPEANALCVEVVTEENNL